MTKLTKKYIFEQKLKGEPIIVLVDEGLGRWVTKEDYRILRECGILIEYHDNEWPDKQTITTHEILTYLIPFNLDHNPIMRLFKGQTMSGFPILT